MATASLLSTEGMIRLRGNGILWVRGEETIRIKGYGQKKEFPSGWTEYIGFRGAAVIEGRAVFVILAGADVDLYAVGSGRATLWGEGRYTIDGLTSQPWSDRLKVITY